ncbi:MAG: M48 family metallopeptidase [Gemmataceae bacterium]|nr:M48 family metallopeptidase [Gemmataceae bacterium]MCI0737994.1 M48 family metallopeptidase [Gemmataceae bacterium]
MAQTFRDLIAANKRNSVLLVAGFVLFTAVVALVLTLAVLFFVDERAALSVQWGRAILIGGIVGVVSFLVALWSYYQGDKMILAVNGAKEIEKKDDPRLFNVVEEMSIAAGVPMPKVYLIHDDAPNAFATGRDPKHAAVAITTGLRDKLNREELQGVMAHEMAHVKNYDIRLMLLLAVLIGTIVMLADVFMQMLRFGGRGSSSRRSGKDGKGAGAVMVIVFIVAILLAIIAPILAQIIQFAVSRQREYLADATAVELTRNPLGLAGALRKISADPAELQSASRGTAHLYIVNPIKKFAARANSVFSSHPPIDQRIARLEALSHG